MGIRAQAPPQMPRPAAPEGGGGQPQAASSPQTPPVAIPPTPFIPEGEAQAHLTRRSEPVYPDAAAEQQIAGTVVLRVTINQAGQVAHIYPVSGPELLVGPAAEAVRRWQYTPFEIDEKISAVHTMVHVPFGELAAAAEQARLLASYRPLWKSCAEAVHGNSGQQMEACRTAEAVAAQLAPGTRPVERRQSAQFYAIALSRAGSYGPAASWAEKALPLFAEPPPNPAAAAATALLLAQARAAAGDLPAASQSLSEAENRFRENLASAPSPELRRLYVAALRSSLQFHANLLTLLRNPRGAQQKLHEAEAF